MVDTGVVYDTVTAQLKAQKIKNAQIADDAAIAYSKLNLTNSLQTADYTDGSVTYAKLSITGQIQESDLVSGISIDIAEFLKEPSLVAMESVSEGDAVYLHPSGGVGLADANDVNKVKAIGIAYANASSGSSPGVVLIGRKQASGYSFATGDKGKDLYLSTTPGGLTTTPPSASGSYIQRMGHVWDTDTILVNVSTEAIKQMTP